MKICEKHELIWAGKIYSQCPACYYAESIDNITKEPISTETDSPDEAEK